MPWRSPRLAAIAVAIAAIGLLAGGCGSGGPLTPVDYELAPAPAGVTAEVLSVVYRLGGRVWTERYLASSEGNVELQRFEAYSTEFTAVLDAGRPAAGFRRFDRVRYRITSSGFVENLDPDLTGLTIVFAPNEPPRSETGDALDPDVARALSLTGFDDDFLATVPVYPSAKWTVPPARQEEIGWFLRRLGLVPDSSLIELTWVDGPPDFDGAEAAGELPLAVVPIEVRWSASGLLVGSDPPVPARTTFSGWLGFDRQQKMIVDLALTATQQWEGQTAEIRLRILRSRYGPPEPALPIPLPFIEEELPEGDGDADGDSGNE